MYLALHVKPPGLFRADCRQIGNNAANRLFWRLTSGLHVTRQFARPGATNEFYFGSGSGIAAPSPRGSAAPYFVPVALSKPTACPNAASS
jgi:hypothetical protein